MLKQLIVSVLIMSACPAAETIAKQMELVAHEIVGLENTQSIELYYKEAQMEALKSAYEEAVSECAKKKREQEVPAHD